VSAASRIRWTRQQASEVLADLEESGLSVAEYARRTGLHPVRLRRWRSELRKDAVHPGLHLVELVARREDSAGRVQIRCPSGHVLEVHGVDVVDGLRAALTALVEVHGC